MSKYKSEQIIEICEKYLSGKKSYHELSFEYNLKKGKPSGCFWRWIALFREQGVEAFIKPTSTHRYIMPIENLRTIVLNGRSIWQKQEEKQLLKNAKKS